MGCGVSVSSYTFSFFVFFVNSQGHVRERQKKKKKKPLSTDVCEMSGLNRALTGSKSSVDDRYGGRRVGPSRSGMNIDAHVFEHPCFGGNKAEDV